MSSYGAEPDASGARFVTRTTVEKCRTARSQAKRPGRGSTPTFSFAEVLRLTEPGRRAVVDLIGAGAVDKVLGPRGGSEISATGPEASLAEQATGGRNEGVERPYHC